MLVVFGGVVALGIRSGSIYRVDIPDGRVTVLHERAGAFPDGVVVLDGAVYWTTMGIPARIPGETGEQGLDYSRRDGGLHMVCLDGNGARDVVPAGSITTGKQLVSDGATTLYWGDREGCRVSRVRVDGTGWTDLVLNSRDSSGRQECVGVAVDPAAGWLYWTQKGPAKGGQGRIFRAGLEIPDGVTASDRQDAEVLWERLPEPIDLEISGDWLYWTDRGAAPSGNTLNRAPIPLPGDRGTAPQILADGFHEAIGLAVDDEAGLVYVSDLGGRISVVALPEGHGRSSHVLADLREPLSGIAGISE